MVPVSSDRSMHNQTSHGFTTRAKAKGVVVGFRATPIIAPSDIECFLHIGILPPPASETAAQAQAWHTENKAHLAAYVVNLEHSTSSYHHITCERIDELTLLIHTIRVACELHTEQHVPAEHSPPLNLNPDFKSLHTAVIESRTQLDKVTKAVNSLIHDTCPAVNL
jgi:hypothetical protein